MADKFKVGDRVLGIRADIEGCEGIIKKIFPSGTKYIEITKTGKHSTVPDFMKGNINKRSCWTGCLKLISPRTLKSWLKNEI